MSLAGKFIVLDGPDGSGKGTQLERLTAFVADQGTTVCRARDPGGTVIGDRVRHVLLGYDLSQMEARCETLLFMASRAQLVSEILRPALHAGQTVLCDRFISATCAYQGAIGIPIADILTVGQLAVGDTWPDLTIILDVPAEVGFARTGRQPQHAGRRNDQGQLDMFSGATPDAMERRPLDFHRKVREIFLTLPQVYPRPVVIIDATGPVDAVWADVREAVQRAAQ